MNDHFIFFNKLDLYYKESLNIYDLVLVLSVFYYMRYLILINKMFLGAGRIKITILCIYF